MRQWSRYDEAIAADRYAKVAGKRERLVMLLDLADASLMEEKGRQSLTVSADDFALFAENYRQAAALPHEHAGAGVVVAAE